MVENVLEATGTWTKTFVDIMEKDETSMPSSIHKVLSLLRVFGSPRVDQFQSSKYMVAHFPTMAEALAATIALGKWYKHKDLINKTCYRVRIVGDYKEARIMDYSGSPCHEAFEMNYFVPASELQGEAEFQKTILSRLMAQRRELNKNDLPKARFRQSDILSQHRVETNKLTSEAKVSEDSNEKVQ